MLTEHILDKSVTLNKLTEKNNVYNVIHNTSNILSSLIENITTNDIFLKHISKLESSENILKKNKANRIKNIIQNVRIFNTEKDPYFLASDIGILLGISNIKMFINKFEKEECIKGYIIHKNKTKQVSFLNTLGIFSCFYLSKTPLAKLFKKFILDIVVHVISNETVLFNNISNKFQIENQDIITSCIEDLHLKLHDYEHLLNIERDKVISLEDQCMEEVKKRQDVENDRVEVELLNSYNIMHIEQLKNDKNLFIDKIKNMQEFDEYHTPDYIELKLIKEKYMKTMYVYLLYPTYMIKQLILKKKEIDSNITKLEINLDKTHQNITDYMIDNHIMYEKNFTQVIDNPDNIQLDNDEILYFYITFGRDVSKNNKLICVNKQYVANKIHFNNCIKNIEIHCDNVYLGKYKLYKTSIDEISDIIREEFINLDTV